MYFCHRECSQHKILTGSIQSLHVIWTVSHFMPCVSHKFLEDVHEDSNLKIKLTSKCVCAQSVNKIITVRNLKNTIIFFNEV